MLAGLCQSATAHKASDAYLQVSGTGESVTLKLSLALRDLDAAIDSLDSDGNRSLEWGEIRDNLPAIQTWVSQGLQLSCASQALPMRWVYESLEQRSDGAYVRLGAAIRCNQSSLGFDYALMRNIDATHRLLVAGALDNRALVAVLSPHTKHGIHLPLVMTVPAQNGWAVFVQFFPEGAHHLATGYDHLAFLLALLLPVMLRSQQSYIAIGASQDKINSAGLWDLLRTVTGFTLGHSVTLVLASLGWIASPGWVEPTIAITIGITAWLNLYPQRWVRADALALGFGLIHGLGFSNIMREANVNSELLPWALAGFNLGVEAGQLVGVALWCGVHLVLVRYKYYLSVVVQGGSWALLALSIYWAVQRLIGG